jgi:hypothetical protein
MYQPRVGERCERLRDGRRGLICPDQNPEWVQVRLDPGVESVYLPWKDFVKAWRWIPSLGTRVVSPKDRLEQVVGITQATISVSIGGGRKLTLPTEAFLRDYRKKVWPQRRAA